MSPLSLDHNKVNLISNMRYVQFIINLISTYQNSSSVFLYSNPNDIASYIQHIAADA